MKKLLFVLLVCGIAQQNIKAVDSPTSVCW